MSNDRDAVSDDDDWEEEDEWEEEEEDDDDGDEFEDDYDRSEYESPQAAVIDACYGAKLFSELSDFAPLHAAIEYVAGKVDDIGLSPMHSEGKQVFLDVVAEVISDDSILEHNPWLACFYCLSEVLPIADERLVQRYFDLKNGVITLQEFYRCPDCGGPINISKKRCEPERHLPWFHYAHGDDFDVADDDLPQR